MEYGLVALWLGCYLVLGFLGLPIAAWLFPTFPDRGTALSLPVALAVVTVVAFLVGHLSLTAGLAAGLVVLFSGSLLAVWRGVDIDFRRVVTPTVVFALSFLFMIAVRAVDPAVHPGGGEKFLDFGLLKSLSRTTRLPPEDIWFAGKPVKYYYGGHLIASLLATLTETGARYAYNLALAGFYATLVTAVYGLSAAIAAEQWALRGARVDLDFEFGTQGSGVTGSTAGINGTTADSIAGETGGDSPSWRLAGALAAFFVGLASNLLTPARAVLLTLPGDAARTVAGWLRVELSGLAASLDKFSYWDASRVIPGTINEFPLFAWLNGDLHAHMTSTPFLVLVAACCLAYYRSLEAEVWRRRALVFGAIPPVAGLLAVVNTWSFPTAAGLVLLTLVFAPASPTTLLPGSLVARFARTQDWFGCAPARIGVSLVLATGVLGLGVGWSLPFWLGPASGRAIGFLPARSPLGPLLLVYGAFLCLFVPYLLVQARPVLGGNKTLAQTAVVSVLALWALIMVAWLVNLAALALFLPIVVVGWALLHRQRGRVGPEFREVSEDRDRGDQDGTSDGGYGPVGSVASGRGSSLLKPTPVRGVGFETVLVIAGAALVILVEFVYVVEEAGSGRFNTVFKIYTQVWVVFGTAAGVVAARLGGALLGGRARLAGRALVAFLVAATSLYGVLALTDHFAGDAFYTPAEPTLDSTAFVDKTHPDEAEAITWLAARTGQPNLVSVPGCSVRAIEGCPKDESLWRYNWVNAPSSLTGVPTVAGWGHEIGYREKEVYSERVQDIRTIYEGSSERRAALLDKYDIRYVYVGPNERRAYDIRAFGTPDSVSVAHRSGGVTIYGINRKNSSHRT